MLGRPTHLMSAPRRQRRVAVIGFGTRGQRAARRLVSRSHEVAVFDSAFAYFDSPPANALRHMRVSQHASVAGVVADRDLVIVTVPAAAAIDVALTAADNLEPGAVYLDATGCSSVVARRVARMMEARGIHHAAASDYEAIGRAHGMILLSDLLAIYPPQSRVEERAAWQAEVVQGTPLVGSSPSTVVPLRSRVFDSFVPAPGVAA